MCDMCLIDNQSMKNSIFRIGEVVGVDGRLIFVRVDKNKNLTHLLYNGTLVRNVSVGGYIKIYKGFTTLVGKVESETLKQNSNYGKEFHSLQDVFYRQLTVKLLGYFENGQYHKGVKEMPLIGNVCQLLELDEYQKIHNFGDDKSATIHLGHLLVDENVPIKISISKLLTSHIGIFGNTGSGKSYTLASILHKLFAMSKQSQKFKENSKFIVLDFNGEYSGTTTITQDKTVYKLNTHSSNGDKLPLKSNSVLDPELLYIMANATEKTQQPFMKRTLMLQQRVQEKHKPIDYFQGILKKQIEKILKMQEGTKASLLLDYLENILPPNIVDDIDVGLRNDLSWHSKQNHFYFTKDSNDYHFNDEQGCKKIPETTIYKNVSKYEFPKSIIDEIIHFMYVQLIEDILNNRAINEHISPVINRFKSFSKDFSKVFSISDDEDLWGNNNLIVIDMNKVNIAMKKLIPLLLCTKFYKEHKNTKSNNVSKTLHIVIDEAHNILSYDSNRESEVWKDYRLETFEEIIKEGRKFGVFMILASQRPSDISPTIISQLHNYFIHRLVNNKDIEMIEKAISYLDKISIESLPILPVGACVLSGIIADLPVVIQINELGKEFRPQSDNVDITEHWGIDEFSLELES